MTKNEWTVESILDREVDTAFDAELRQLLADCFLDTPIFATQRHWREHPYRRWFIRDDGRLIAHACIHRRVLNSDDGELLVGGVAEVCVRPEYRGKKLVKRLLDEVHAALRHNEYEFAMLFGRQEVYASSGYIAISNPLHYRDWETRQMKTEPYDGAMICPLTQRDWPKGVIDLKGPIF